MILKQYELYKETKNGYLPHFDSSPNSMKFAIELLILLLYYP